MLMLLISFSWIIPYIIITITGHYPYSLYFEARLLILALPTIFIGGVFVLLFSDVERHLRILSYIHGLFTSIPILTLSFVLGSTPLLISTFYRSPMETTLFKLLPPPLVMLLLYSLFYSLYSLSAYSTISKALLATSKNPPWTIIGYWRLSSVAGLVFSLMMIPLLLLGEPHNGARHIASYLYSMIVSILLLLLGIDELWKGKLRHIRYPIIAPLIIHSSWLLAYVPKTLIKPITYGISELIYPAFVLIGYVFPGLRVMFGSLEFNIPLFLLGLWLLFEWLAFYHALSYESFEHSLREGVISLF